MGRPQYHRQAIAGSQWRTLKAFIDQAPSAVAREEAEKVLGKLTEGSDS